MSKTAIDGKPPSGSILLPMFEFCLTVALDRDRVVTCHGVTGQIGQVTGRFRVGISTLIRFRVVEFRPIQP